MYKKTNKQHVNNDKLDSKIKLLKINKKQYFTLTNKIKKCFCYNDKSDANPNLQKITTKDN